MFTLFFFFFHYFWHDIEAPCQLNLSNEDVAID